MPDYTEEEVQEALENKAYWEALAPKGYRLMAMTYKQSALFSCPGDRRTVSIDSDHVDFFLGEHE